MLHFRKITTCIITLQLFVFSTPALFAGKSANQGCCGCSSNTKAAEKPTDNPTAKPMITDETDKTDIYAIPLDNDEKEENQELEMLEKGK